MGKKVRKSKEKKMKEEQESKREAAKHIAQKGEIVLRYKEGSENFAHRDGLDDRRSLSIPRHCHAKRAWR